MQLEDGYKYAKYSDKMKYCILWETQNATEPVDLEAWKTYFVPFLIEHHFKDPRYMTIDNKLVFPSFGSYMAGNGWGTEERKEAFDYLTEQVKLLGFDGLILSDVDWARGEDHKTQGIESIYSYNHGSGGAFYNNTVERILALAKDCEELDLYYIPTISTGFNAIGWDQGRSPLMSIEDYIKINEWVKNEYLGKRENAPAWAEDLVWLSTWNEYGEGTYLMPAEGHNGFGYLDVIREAYTTEKADPTLNTIPTAAQLERINRLYPQHKREVRSEEKELYTNGIYEPKSVYDAKEEKLPIDYETSLISIDDNLDTGHGTIINDSDKNGKVLLSLDYNIDFSRCKVIQIKANVPTGKFGVFAYGNSEGSGFKTSASVLASGTGKTEIFEIDIEGEKLGNVLQLTLPAGTKVFDVDLVFVTKDCFGYNITVDGRATRTAVPSELSPRGELLVGFDVGFTNNHFFGMFAEWEFDAKKLTVNLPDGAVYEFTAGQSYYKLNGEKYFLGYELYLKDRVPMIPLSIFTERYGHTIDASDFRNITVTK